MFNEGWVVNFKRRKSGRHDSVDDDGAVVFCWGCFMVGDGPYCHGIVLIERGDEFVGVNVGQGFPAVMCIGESLPPD